MPNCERCGKYINVNEVYKREIYSGKTNKVYYGKRISFGNNFRYSIKSVCRECAESIDKGKNSGYYIFLFIVVVIVLLLILGSK